MSDPLAQVRATWDGHAADYDTEPDHGLGDPTVRSAWRSLLLDHLPPAPARIADLGCGTGSLAVLLAEEGYDVHGVDLDARRTTELVREHRSEVTVRHLQEQALWGGATGDERYLLVSTR